MSIRQRKSKKTKNGYVWEVYFTYKERGIPKRYSKSGFASKKLAQDHETEIKAQLLDTGKINKDTTLTLHDVYLEFLEVGTNEYQENTITSTKQNFNTNMLDIISYIPIVDFTDYKLLQNYFNSRETYSIARNKNTKKALNRILNYAIKCGYIKSHPLHLVTVKGVDTTRVDKVNVIEEDDFNILINYLITSNKFMYRSFVIALYIGKYMGLRISETFALNKQDIDFQNDLITINKKLIYRGMKIEELHTSNKTKTKHSTSTIPIVPQLKEILLEWFNVNPHEILICDENGWYCNPATLSNLLTKLSKRLDININYHMLRHTLATSLVLNDTDLKTAQEILRHGSISTTMDIYTHIDFTHKKQALNDVFEIKSVEKVSNKEKVIN